MITFKIGDRVRIMDSKSELNGFDGTIIDSTFQVLDGFAMYAVKTAEGTEYFYPTELELYAENFEERLSMLMSARGINLREFSEATGITEVTLCRYLRGTIIPRGDKIVKIAKVLQCTTDYLLGV